MSDKLSRRTFLMEATGVALACALDSAHAASSIGSVRASSSKPGSLMNVAKNRAVYQSTSIDDDHTGHLVTDGSPATYWQCKPGGEQWIAIDLGDVYTLSNITVLWGQLFASQYRLEISQETRDPQQWTTVFSRTDGRGGEEYATFPTVSARYIRLVGVSSSDGHGFSVCEVKALSEKLLQVPSVQVLSRTRTLLTEGWSLTNAMFVHDDPSTISTAAFESDWLPAIVPGTVLASYLTAGAIPDPNYANQQEQISEEFFTRNDFWYRNSFEIASNCQGKRLWLVFAGVNWKADVYLNGKELGKIEGAYVRQRFEITENSVCGGKNCLAVRIHKVAHPGEILHKQLGKLYPNGGILGIDSPTSVSSIGWNWLPTIRGRNIGIWDDVRFEMSGDVLLIDPWVASTVSQNNEEAQLTVRTEVQNLSSVPCHCTLNLQMEDQAYRLELSLGPHEVRQVAIDQNSWRVLAIKNPRLWWPNGYGEPTLHIMNLSLQHGGKISDETAVSFGIRTTECRHEEGGLKLYVNGHRMLCRGGNWGMEDSMLICDSDGYDLRIRMHRDLNLVMIRNWVGMVLRDAFYQACDRHGLLVWDDFWLANPDNGPDPEDRTRFMHAVVDKIKRVRHHPSVGLYCGRNEGRAPEDLDVGMKAAVQEFDGTRYYLPDSASGEVTGRGPYEVKDPAWYFENRGTTFHSEQGIVCVPPVESMRAMMSEKDLWPISDMWAVHDYQKPRSPLYTQRIESRYGAPTSIEDYCRKAQMVNLESAKAICECLQSGQGGGLLIWMTQAAWPCLICQLYDYYFEQTAAYFGTKSACEPLHLFWNQHTNVVEVANNTLSSCQGLSATARVYDLDGKERWTHSVLIDASPSSVHACFQLEKPSELSFVKLELHKENKVLSENFYWTTSQEGDCRGLNSLSIASLDASAHAVMDKYENAMTVTVSNPSPTVALAIRLKMTRKLSGERVLPAMYEDNYFSLLPQESKRVKITYPVKSLANELPRLLVEGWNVKPSEIQIHS